MTQIPIAKETIDRIAAANKIQNPGKASIREMRKMIQDVEKETGIRFVKMEMGIPGLPLREDGDGHPRPARPAGGCPGPD